MTQEVQELLLQRHELRRKLYELFEVTRPGMEHGDLDDDYAAVIGSIRRMRAIADYLESRFPEAAPS